MTNENEADESTESAESEVETCDNCGRPLGTEEEMEAIDWEVAPVQPKCFSECLFDGDTDRDCAEIAKDNALKAAEADMVKIIGLEKRVLELEEQLAYMEQARDNALTMRDEAQKQKKQSGESAARRIEALIALAREMAEKAEGSSDFVAEVFEPELARILAKEPSENIQMTTTQLTPTLSITSFTVAASPEPWTDAWVIAEKEKTRDAIVPVLENALGLKYGTVGPEGAYEIDAILMSLNLPPLPGFSREPHYVARVPEAKRCGKLDDRGHPCVRLKGHEKQDALCVTEDGRGFHGPKDTK